MKKLLMIAVMTMAPMGIQAQNTVTVQDATNMSAKELKAAAKEQSKKESAMKDWTKAKAGIAKAEKAVVSAEKAVEKAQDKVKSAEKAAQKAKDKADDARKDLEKAKNKAEDARKKAEALMGTPLLEEK